MFNDINNYINKYKYGEVSEEEINKIKDYISKDDYSNIEKFVTNEILQSKGGKKRKSCKQRKNKILKKYFGGKIIMKNGVMHIVSEDYILEDGEVDVTDKLSNNTAESQRARDNEENSNTFIIAFPIILFISYLIALALK